MKPILASLAAFPLLAFFLSACNASLFGLKTRTSEAEKPVVAAVAKPPVVEQRRLMPAVVKPPLLDPIPGWCEELKTQIASLKWDLDPCADIDWHVGGFSVEGRPLIYAEFGNPSGSNKTLILSMTHGDENTPLYVGLKMAYWLKENLTADSDIYVVVAPLVNPDGFLKRTRVNANGVDLNRNFATADWKKDAIRRWKSRYRSNPRRYPGNTPASEPETIFQERLIERMTPNKILSIHAPLNFFDYDGPTALSLDRFPEEYVKECVKLRKSLKAVHFGFYPGSLGNYAGQERGIPTLTLELPSANGSKAPQYWDKFSNGIRAMIEFQVPEFDSESATVGSATSVRTSNR